MELSENKLALLRITAKIIASCYFIFSAPLALSSDFQSARTVGLGGAGHAGPLFTDAIYLNPSFLSLMPGFALSAHYQLYSGNSASSMSGTLLNISAMASFRELPVQFGLGYTRRDDGTLIHLAVSREILDRLTVGVGAKLLRFTPDLSMALTVIITNWLKTAAIVDNLAETLVASGFAREYTLGVKLNPASFLSLNLDPHWSLTSQWGFDIGAEVSLWEYLFIRGGGFKSSQVAYLGQRGDGMAAGIGVLLPFVSIEYSVSTLFPIFSSVSHSFGLTIHF